MPGSYLPIDRRHALAESRPLPTRTHGVVLLADLTGFTRHAEALVTHLGERRGPEALLARLGDIFGALIASLHAYGGAVIGFSGDAITCWLDGDDGVRGVAVGLDMQRVMKTVMDDAVADFGSPIGLKVALARGPVRRWEVGRPELRLLEAMEGLPVHAAAEIESMAQVGEVLLDDALRRALGERVVVERSVVSEGGRAAWSVVGLRDVVRASPWPPLESFDVELARARLADPVFARARTGHTHVLTGLRRTTPLFIQFAGIDYERDDGAMDQLDSFIRKVDEIVDTYDGTLMDLTIGEKGHYLYVNFGALQAHPDDSKRAVSAALDVLEVGRSAEGINLVRAGVSTGRVVVGSYGTEARRAFVALGDEVNLAARLMQRAEPWDVIISERVREALGSSFRVSSRGSMQLKGKSEPVALHAVHGSVEAGSSVRGSPGVAMVGRDAEQRQLGKMFLDCIRGGELRLALVQGEPGIGKSALIVAFAATAERMGADCFVGGADAIQRTRPYQAVREVFRQMLDLDATVDADVARRRIEALLPAAERRRAPLLRVVTPFDWEDNDFTRELAGEVRAFNTVEALLTLFGVRAQASPLALVFEDLHWCDSASWSFLTQLARRATNTFIALTTRPPGAERGSVIRPEDLDVLPADWRIDLRPLERHEIRDLMLRRLRVDDVVESLVDTVFDETRGQPLYCEELLTSLSERGLIAITDGRARLAPRAQSKGAETVSESVTSVINARVDHLSAQAQTALRVGSVIGREFSSEQLTALASGLDVALEVPAAIHTLVDADLVERAASGRWQFRHALVQDAVYDGMTFSLRKQIHLRLAESLESLGASDERERYDALLAHHWLGAEQPARAVVYLERAGEYALVNFANREVVRHLELARRIDPDPDPVRHGRWGRTLADAYHALGDIPEARRAGEGALETLGLGQPGPWLLPLVLMWQVGITAARAFVPWLWPLLSGTARERSSEAAKAHANLCQVYYYQNEELLMTYSVMTQLNLSGRVGVSAELAKAYALGCALATVLPMTRLSERWASDALGVADRLGDPWVRAFVLIRASMSKASLSEWAAGKAMLEEALSVAEDRGDWRMATLVLAMLGELLALEGRFDEGREIYRRSTAVGREHDDAQAVGWGLVGEGRMTYRLGAVDEGLDILERAMEPLALAGSKVHEFDGHGLLAEGYAARGDYAKARVHIDRGIALVGYKRPVTYFILSGHAGIARALLTTWEDRGPDRALRKLTARNVKLLRTFASVFPFASAQSEVVAGLHAWLLGREAKALAAWRRAVDLARRHRMPIDEASAHYELARHLAPGAPDRETHLVEAERLFGEAGARADLARTHRLRRLGGALAER